MQQTMEILRNKLDKEMDEFRHSYDTMTVKETYNDYYIISFYEEYYEMLMSDFVEQYFTDEEIEWLTKFNKILAFLYSEWLSFDGAFSHNWDDMLDFILSMCREEHK